MAVSRKKLLGFLFAIPIFLLILLFLFRQNICDNRMALKPNIRGDLGRTFYRGGRQPEVVYRSKADEFLSKIAALFIDCRKQYRNGGKLCRSDLECEGGCMFECVKDPYGRVTKGNGICRRFEGDTFDCIWNDEDGCSCL